MGGLCSLPGSCLAWDDPVLGSTGCMVGLTSQEAYTSSTCCCQCPRPYGEPLLTQAFTGEPLQHYQGHFDSVSCGVTAPFLWVLVHARFHLCAPRLESLFPPVLWKFDNQIPLAFKVRFPQDFQSLCQIPRLGSLMLGSEPPQWRENFFGIIVLQFVGQSPGGHGVWFHHDCAPPTISLRLLCHWALGIFFWWVPAFSSQWLFRR